VSMILSILSRGINPVAFVTELSSAGFPCAALQSATALSRTFLACAARLFGNAAKIPSRLLLSGQNRLILLKPYRPVCVICARHARTTKKDVLIIHKISNIPPCEVLVEHVGIIKHGTHVPNPKDVPIPDWLVELTCVHKHGSHVCNIRDIPTSNWLVEGFRTLKHARHIGDI
jgi:hypothetical protein